MLSFNTALSLAGMHGILRSSAQPPAYWPALFIIILFLSVQGWVGWVRSKNHAFALLWVISLVIAAGVTIEYTKPVYLWLYENIFFFRGFREPQKLIGVVALVYAYLAAVGMEGVKKGYVMLLIPFLYTPALFFGFSGALVAQDYPKDYYETDAYLNADEEDFNILVLPWHLYMDYGWNQNDDKRLANVAPSFFSKPVISGDNMEVGGYIRHHKTRAQSILSQC